MARLIARINRLAATGSHPDDPPDLALKRSFVFYMGLAMSFGGLLWGTICVMFGVYGPSLVPFGYTFFSFVNFGAFSLHRSFPVARFVQLAMSLLLPFMFQWILGGFVASGAMMLWSLLALIGSFSLYEMRKAYNVLWAFLALTAFSGLIDATLKGQGLNVPEPVSILFFVLNISVIATSVFLLTYSFNTQQEAMRNRLEALDRAKSDFLSTVSHELRTPLTSVLGFTDMIEEKLEKNVFPEVVSGGVKSEKAIRQIRRNIEVIRSEGKRLTTLINDVLDLTKMESGALEWRSTAVSMKEVVEQSAAATASLFANRPELSLDVRVEGPAVSVMGDRDRLMQVVINLLSNAVKFTERGTIRLAVSRVVSGDAAWCEVRISDQGIGIAPGDLETIFEKFKQVGDTLTDRPKGSGLGLPISRRIAEHHGGRLWAESQPGQGSTFILRLPASASDGAPVRQAETRARTVVLIADDDPSIRELVTQGLEGHDMHLISSADGVDALARARSLRPDVLVLDIMMPGLDGFEVARQLRASPETRPIPILMLSVLDEHKRALELGIEAYLKKPIDMALFRGEIDRLIRRAAPAAQGAVRP